MSVSPLLKLHSNIGINIAYIVYCVTKQSFTDGDSDGHGGRVGLSIACDNAEQMSLKH